MAFEEINDFFRGPGGFDQGVGDVLLSGRGDPALLVAGLDDRRPVLGDVVTLDQAGVLVGVDELVPDLPRMVGVDLEQVLHGRPAVVPLAEKTFEGDVGLEVLEDGDGLVGQAVELGRGEVHPVVVLREEVVDEAEDGQDEDDHEEKVPRVEEGLTAEFLFEGVDVPSDMCRQGGEAEAADD